MTPRSAWAAGGNPLEREEDAAYDEPVAPEVLREFLMAHLSAIDAWRLTPDDRTHRDAAMRYGRALGRYLRAERLGAA